MIATGLNFRIRRKKKKNLWLTWESNCQKILFNKCWDYAESRACPGAQSVKNPPAMQEMQKTWVWSLGWEDTLKEGMATSSSILAWRIAMDRGEWCVTVHGVAKSKTQLKWLSIHTHMLNPCMEVFLGYRILKKHRSLVKPKRLLQHIGSDK